MITHLWTPVQHDAALAAAWIDGRVPQTVPHWVWAALLVIVALIIGRIGGRVLAGLVQLALLAAAVLVAWQMVRTNLPVPARSAAPAACVLEGTCAATAPPAAATPAASSAQTGSTTPVALVAR